MCLARLVGGSAPASRITAALVFVLPLLAAPAGAAWARQESSILIDYETGQVLEADDPDLAAFPASLTKMMTLYLVFDALEAGRLTLDTRLRISQRAASMPPTKLGLKAGSSIRVEDAIMALVTRSANDIAAAIGENLGGSESRFAELMTTRARELGMSRTTFRNASGLPDPAQRTTARDLATLSMHLINDHPRYYRFFSRERFAFGGRSIGNHNHLMSRYAGMDGIKTGYTNASGFNLAASAVRDGHRLVAVVMGGSSAPSRDLRMAKLLDRGFVQIARGRRPTAPVVVASLPEVREAAYHAPPVTSVPAPQPLAVADIPAQADVVVDPALAAVAAAKSATVAAPPARTRTAQKTKAARKPAPVATASRSKPSNRRVTAAAYGVELGTFRNAAAARKAAQQAVRQAPNQLGGTFVNVHSVKQRKKVLFRAQLLGTDRDDANTACRQLRRHRQACTVVQTEPVTVASN